ncbi:MAG: dTDP-4-dehydrorhamnose 3,5-epimerase [Parvularculaceae bacterium]|nr:dTDP-4-dehydrorhamnose 3,5-epimerase [Parvularculaceae bacterium]
MLDVNETDIKDVLLVTPKRHSDARGFFCETYNAERFREAGISEIFVQDNHSLSIEAGTVRGLHYQAPPRAQAKLVRVLKGAVYDIAVDVRKGSPTYGRHVRALLSADNGAQLLIPAGFLHGFATIEANTEVAYKVSDFYSAAHDGSVLWNDPALGIDWGIVPAKAVLSDKDAKAVSFAEFSSPF